MNILIMGPAGSGKGTMSAKILESFKIPAHLHRRYVPRQHQRRHGAGEKSAGIHERRQARTG